MPRTTLTFLKPLYDIAVWQYILMCGHDNADSQRKPTMTYHMHEVVANILCKLLEASAYSHLRERIEDEEIRNITGQWNIGDPASKKLVDWCQDQWRRKVPNLPSNSYGTGEPLCVPLFGANMPLCHVCGVPCPECREELGQELPAELSSARELLHPELENVTTELEENAESEQADSRRLRSRKRKMNT